MSVRLPSLVVILFVAVVACGCVLAGAASVLRALPPISGHAPTSESFSRIVSTRHVFANNTRSLPWPALPTPSMVSPVPWVTDDSLIFLSTNKLYLFSTNSSTIAPVALPSLPVALREDTSTLASDPRCAELFVAVAGFGLLHLACVSSHDRVFEEHIARGSPERVGTQVSWTCTLKQTASLPALRTPLALHVAGPTPPGHRVALLASPLGLKLFDAATGALTDPPFVCGAVTALAVDPASSLVALSAASWGARALGDGPGMHSSAALVLWDRAAGSVQHFFVGGILDRNATALAFGPDGSLWAGTDVCAARVTPTPLGAKTAWVFERVGGHVENPGSVVSFVCFLNVFLYVCLSVCMCMCVCVRVCVFVCVCRWIYVEPCVCICLSPFPVVCCVLHLTRRSPQIGGLPVTNITLLLSGLQGLWLAGPQGVTHYAYAAKVRLVVLPVAVVRWSRSVGRVGWKVAASGNLCSNKLCSHARAPTHSQ
jgi:hypothetical protein